MITIWGLPTIERRDKKFDFCDKSLEIRRGSLPDNLDTGLDVILITCVRVRSIFYIAFRVLFLITIQY